MLIISILSATETTVGDVPVGPAVSTSRTWPLKTATEKYFENFTTLYCKVPKIIYIFAATNSL